MEPEEESGPDAEIAQWGLQLKFKSLKINIQLYFIGGGLLKFFPK